MRDWTENQIMLVFIRHGATQANKERRYLGKTDESLSELKDDAQYQEWLRSNGTLNFPEGESRKDFILRCKGGFIKMCHELSQVFGQKAKNPALVGMIVHGGTIMSLLSLYGGKDYFDCQVSNGRGYVCRLTGVNGRTTQEDNLQIKVVAEI